MNSDNNSLPLSSPLPDQDNNDISYTGEDESSSVSTEGGQEDMTQTLSRFAEQAKLEGSVYRKLLDELKKMANPKT